MSGLGKQIFAHSTCCLDLKIDACDMASLEDIRLAKID